MGTTNAINSTIKVGGWVGIVTAAVASYAAFAAVIKSTFGHLVAPVFPLRTAS